MSLLGEGETRTDFRFVRLQLKRCASWYLLVVWCVFETHPRAAKQQFALVRRWWKFERFTIFEGVEHQQQ